MQETAEEAMGSETGDRLEVKVGGEAGTQGDAQTFRLGRDGEGAPEIRIQGSKDEFRSHRVKCRTSEEIKTHVP